MSCFTFLELPLWPALFLIWLSSSISLPVSTWGCILTYSWVSLPKEETPGQHRSPDFRGHVPCYVSLMYLLTITELMFLRGLCGYQGDWRITPCLCWPQMFPVWSYGRVVLILDGRFFLLEIWHWLPTSKRKIRNSQTVPTILQIWLLQL